MLKGVLKPLLAAGFVLASGLTVLSQEAKMSFPEELIPRFNIPKMSKPPVADGKIDPEEWKEAVKVMGMVNTSSLDFRGRPVSFWIGWDAEHLYIAARSNILPGHRLYRASRERVSTSVVCDDSYEFGIFMHDRNKPESETSSFLKIVLNSMGSGDYMKIYPSIGQNMYNWTPDAKIGNLIYEKDGTQWWDMELTMDLKDLQMPVPNKAGDKMDILLAGDLKNPGWQWLDFPSASGHLVHHGFPRATLTSDKPYVQVEEISGLHDEKLRLRTMIFNPSDKPVTVKTLVRLRSGKIENFDKGAKEVFNEVKDIPVPAKGSARFDVDKDFPGLEYAMLNQWSPANKSALDFEISSEAAPVYTFHCTFFGTKKEYLKSEPRDSTKFDYEMKFNPVNNKLFISGDTLDTKFPEGSKPAALAYAVDKDGKVAKEGKITLVVNYKYGDFVELPKLEEGKYRVTLTFVDAAGKALISRNDINFDKKDEAKAFSAWWNNKIGDTEKLLAPFEALKVKSDGPATAISCTRREYQLDGLGMPKQIIANKGNVLTRPARIMLKVDGKEIAVPADGKISVTSAKDWRVEFTGQAEAANIAFSVKGWMEQDGLVNLDLTYAPKSGAVSIEDLRVEWPVDGALGSWMTCIGGTGGNYSARSIGKVPDGQGAVWNTLDNIGQTGSTMIVGNWENNLWIGNDARGLLWCADSDQGWVPNNKAPAHSLVRKDGEIAIVNHIINIPKGEKPFVLDAPRTIQLQYNATPFRNFASGWRLTQVSAANGFAWPDYKTNKKTKQEYFSILSMPSTDVNEWPEYYAKYKAGAEQCSKTGWYSISPRLTKYLTNQIALRGYMDKTTEPGMYQYFAADWVPGNESLNKSYRDYMIYLMNKHVREGGVTHYYFDISFSRDAADPIAGFGYRLPDGKIQPSSLDGTLREWYKRVWALMLENNLYPGGVSGHATNSICLRALPWTDAILDSEYPMPESILTYPPDRMIALSVPHNFGVNISHLGFMNPYWAVMHDAAPGGGGGPFYSEDFRRFGISADDVEFTGYWRGQIVKKAGQGLIASVWKRPGKAVVAVMNYGLDPAGQEKTRQCEITLDPKTLGIPDGITPQQIRASEMNIDNGVIPGRYIGQYKWYADMPESKHPLGWQEKVKLRPPAVPKFDVASGNLGGFDALYHDVRYILITWDDKPFDETALKKTFTDDKSLAAALNWGVNRLDVKQVADSDAAVKVEKGGVKVQAWTRPGTVMLQIANSADKPTEAVLAIDLAKLGVKVPRLWEKYTQCVGGTLDAPGGKVTVKEVKPGQPSLVFIDTF